MISHLSIVISINMKSVCVSLKLKKVKSCARRISQYLIPGRCFQYLLLKLLKKKTTYSRNVTVIYRVFHVTCSVKVFKLRTIK